VSSVQVTCLTPFTLYDDSLYPNNVNLFLNYTSDIVFPYNCFNNSSGMSTK